MSRRLILTQVDDAPKICYISSEHKIITPYSEEFGANIVSNNYSGRQGVLKFDAPVLFIGEKAFYTCNTLTSITIPESVTSIGYRAFYGCSRLTSITIPDSVTEIGAWVFYGCTSLTSVTIGNGVTEIANRVFQNCKSLTSITLPNDVTTIGDYAFLSCARLRNVTIPNGVTTIGSDAFAKTALSNVTIPENVTKIGGTAFENCTGILTINMATIPTGSMSSDSKGGIGSFGHSNFTKVIISDTVKSVGEHSFYYTNIEEVVIGNNAQISSNPFDRCLNLKKFSGKYSSDDGRCLINTNSLIAFAPEGLTSYTIPNSVTSIGKYAFYGCKNLINVVIPDSVTAIGEKAFNGCSSLISINIPNSVTSIRSYTFQDCTSLQSITIPEGVTRIETRAFTNCKSLTSITIPRYVSSIGISAFSGCGNLTNVYCECVTPPTGETSMFNTNAADRKIYVPMESVEAYKSATYWNKYADAIVGYDFENNTVIE